MAATDKAVDVLHLVKNYGDVRAVKDISFEVKRGELFAFLGLNLSLIHISEPTRH